MNHKDQTVRIEGQIATYWELVDRLRADRHRPGYHFVPPAGWMNDVNGSIFWKGRYHIFYQHNPDGGYWNWMQWGHASSVDLVHWVDHPIALTPTEDGGDWEGCFSGGAFVNKAGVVTFIYYGLNEGICLATSDDDMLLKWTKHPGNPVIPEPVEGDADFGRYTLGDPCAWVEGETYYAAVNRADPKGQGDGAYLFKSTDLDRWEFVDLFYESDRKWTEADEDCAVPDVYRLGDKWMLLFCSHLKATQYYLGQIVKERFVPQRHGMMSWGAGNLGGPRTLLDGRGRRIFSDWIGEVRDPQVQRRYGWAGVMTLPRVLSLAADGTLRIEPIEELEVLRVNEWVIGDVELDADSEVTLEEIAGDSLELAMEFEPQGAQAFGVKVRCSPEGQEQTVIACAPAPGAARGNGTPADMTPAAGELRVELGQSTLDDTVRYPLYRGKSDAQRDVDAQVAPFELGDGERLNLRVFVDRSVVEVYANGRQCVTQRIYPTRDDSVGVRLFARGGKATARSVRGWEMAPTH